MQRWHKLKRRKMCVTCTKKRMILLLLVPSTLKPRTTKSKRPTNAIPCSPSKFKKNNVPKDLRRFVDHVIQEDCAGQTSKTANDDDILAIMEEVAKCEASGTSDEYNMATSCLLNHQTIASFMQWRQMKGDWLKRQFDERK